MWGVPVVDGRIILSDAAGRICTIVNREEIRSSRADSNVIYLDHVVTTMGTGLQTPSVRECELCDRSERWDEEDETWRIREEDGERQVGNPHCIHEWNITGSFTPFEQ
jgi:hypothetical protein